MHLFMKNTSSKEPTQQPNNTTTGKQNSIQRTANKQQSRTFRQTTLNDLSSFLICPNKLLSFFKALREEFIDTNFEK